MTNTVLIKRSGTANSIPTAGQLTFGELAINYNDGNLFYKNAGGAVTLLTSNQFVSVAGNITGGNLNAVGLSLSGNVVSTFNVTGNINGGNLRTGGLISATANITGGNVLTGGIVSAAGIVSGVELTATNAVGSEGGQINLAAAPSGTLSGTSVTIDIYNNQLRFFEQGGSARGAYIDLSAAAAGVGSNLLAGGSGTVPTQIVNGTSNVVVTSSGNITANVAGAWVASFYSAGMIANSFWANNNATGQNFKVGDDAWIGDINLADTMSVRGQQNAANGYIVFGNADGTQLGRAGSGPLTYGGAFSATGNITGGNIISVAAVSGVSVVATGNITGGNLLTAGLISTSANISGNNIQAGNVLANGTMSSAGAVTAGTFATAGLITATGNITGGNILTSGIISATSNISGGNLAAVTNIFSFGTIQGTGNVSGGNLTTGAQVSATGNITGGNLNAAGLSLSSNVVSALNVTSNIAGGNITTPGLISATGNITSAANITGGNFIVSGVVVDNTGNLELQSTATNGNINLTPNGTGIVGVSTSLSVTGNITGGNLNAAGLSLSSNVVSAINSTSNITTTANISAGYFLGNGSQLTGITASVSKISNGTSEANIGASGGNANITIGGTSNVAVFTTTGLNITGTVSATANVNTGNVTVTELFYNSTTVDSNFTTPAGFNAHAAGPITVQNGVIGTVSNGTAWVIV